MAEEPTQPGIEAAAKMRKACQISLMFQVESDADALAVKQAIDACLPDIENKRYTFQITEM